MWFDRVGLNSCTPNSEIVKHVMVFTVNVLLLMGLKGEIRGWENLETRENSQRSTICCCGLTELG